MSLAAGAGARLFGDMAGLRCANAVARARPVTWPRPASCCTGYCATMGRQPPQRARSAVRTRRAGVALGQTSVATAHWSPDLRTRHLDTHGLQAIRASPAPGEASLAAGRFAEPRMR